MKKQHKIRCENLLSTLVICCFLMFSGFKVSSQPKAASFEEIKLSGLRISQLDSTYKNAVGSGDVVFGDQEDKFIAAYKKMMLDLGSYLKSNNFSFKAGTRSFTRIYFKSDGSIDYFLYNFKEGAAKPEEIAAFDKLLKEFVKTFNLGMTAPVNFVQCSPTVFQ